VFGGKYFIIAVLWRVHH